MDNWWQPELGCGRMRHGGQAGTDMTLSARNQILGKLCVIKMIARARMDIGNGTIIAATIMNEAVDDLGLKEGDDAIAVIKASDAVVAR